MARRIDIIGDVNLLHTHIPKDVKFQLVIGDPPYGDIVNRNWDKISDVLLAKQLVLFCKKLEAFCLPGAALYLYGGYGTPRNRAWYRFVTELEHSTNWQMAAHLTWHKKRGYGVQNNYLSTREEIAYCVLGDIKHPRVFNVPYLDKLRGYDGYNKDYPARSKFKRRTMVWDDITEILSGKVNECEKPREMSNVMIETSSNPDDWVLDAWAGSRNCATVAEALNRNVISIEKYRQTNDYQQKKYHKESRASHKRLENQAALLRVQREIEELD